MTSQRIYAECKELLDNMQSPLSAWQSEGIREAIDCIIVGEYDKAADLLSRVRKGLAPQDPAPSVHDPVMTKGQLQRLLCAAR